MSMRPAPLGEISPSPRTSRRSRSSRSPSPLYSPRSERRYSPARSDRGGYRYQEKGGRRQEESGGRRYRRDDSPRSERSDRYSDRETEYTRGPANTGVYLLRSYVWHSILMEKRRYLQITIIHNDLFHIYIKIHMLKILRLSSARLILFWIACIEDLNLIWFGYLQIQFFDWSTLNWSFGLRNLYSIFQFTEPLLSASASYCFTLLVDIGICVTNIEYPVPKLISHCVYICRPPGVISITIQSLDKIEKQDQWYI